MSGRTGIVGGVVALAAIVAAALFFLQNFDAAAIACEDIPKARAEVQAQKETGVEASVALYAAARESAETRLSACLRAEPEDPCEAEQAARDAAYKAFFAIPSPANDAPYAEFQTYFAQRDDAYATYKTAKAALDQCRAANPPKEEVPYEESDTKACFDEYDASMAAAQDTFTTDTQALRTALSAALAALDAREKSCNPPTGDDKFSLTPGTGPSGEDYAANIRSCAMIDTNTDPELIALSQRAAELQVDLDATATTLENAGKKATALRVDISNVDTYIPPESTKTQFEGALNALRGQRKANLEFSLDYYQKLIERKQAEQEKLRDELADVEAQIAARIAAIQKENQERRSKYPTAIHQAGPDECKYYHCHGTLCGIPDPRPNECGHGATAESDLECKAFLDAYLKAAGGR